MFNISTKLDGSTAASMDNLDQLVSVIPVKIVTYKYGYLSLEVKFVMGIFEGTLKEGSKNIKGKMETIRVNFSARA